MNKYIYIALIAVLGLSSCEDQISLDLQPGPAQLVIDAVINDQPEEQVVRLTLSAPYFDNVPTPSVSDAEVKVTDSDGKEFVFTDEDKDGNYTWQPTDADEVIGVLGKEYSLSVTYKGDEFIASSKVNRVPPIDSLTYEYREAEGFRVEGVYASLWAVDPIGTGDTYWIRTYRNDTLLNRPADINTAYDGGFSAGANSDGIPFILPIREGINPFYADEDDELLSPYQEGDKIRVELLSVTNDVVFFLQQAQAQLQNGGLFATPLENISSNIQNADTSSETEALGYFIMCSEVSAEVVVGPEEE
ncbi:DUF4249 domain-containing protein [Flammeovirgaceae bacterium SG7u.111]|nr:DUF4249 domain-containing protein [Flammeovirgaceae bacterium SG7u.132]WPO33261.1 DUF4249 domain-containing protein [Flammeovirgaceae bacterium SG7u.111]